MSKKKNTKARTDSKIAADYYPFPEKILASTDKFKFLFLCKYQNLDAVLNGRDVIDRPHVVACIDGSILVVNLSERCTAKAGDHVFVGACRISGVAMAYVESRTGNTAYIGCMSSELLTKEAA